MAARTHRSRRWNAPMRYYPLGLLCLLWASSPVTVQSEELATAGRVWNIRPSDQAQYQLVERFIAAQPGDVIQLEAGTYRFDTELNLLCDHVTLRGRGHDKTILSFDGQRFGAGGIMAQGNSLVFEDLAVEDTAGNAIKVHDGNGVIFRRVRVEWTAGPRTENGAYGIYPVECQNVLIEHCQAIGASDAGIYVGQCHNVIVRHCHAEYNVAGIEIENTLHADVHDNVATHNAGGLLVFDLPGLNVTNGGHVRLFRNTVADNNTKNFAPKGTMVAEVPTGTGVMILATDRVEVFDNTIEDHQTANVTIMSFHVTQRPVKDDRYDAYPEGITVRDNRIRHGGYQPEGTFATLLKPVVGRTFPDILFDGDLDPGKRVDGRLPDDLQLRLENNGDATFVNLHLDNLKPELVLTGRYSLDRDPAAYQGRHAAEAAVQLPEFPPRGTALNPAVAVYEATPRQLSDWGLFTEPLAAQQPVSDLLPYDLNTALYSDDTQKLRFIRLPQGHAMTYQAESVFDFPDGTAIVKTFGYPGEADTDLQLLETRIETLVDGAWYGFSYIWNDEQTDAELALGGAVLPVAIRDAEGNIHQHEYHVPNANQCVTCHGQHGKFLPIGPTAGNLNRVAPDGDHNQLLSWIQEKHLDGAPEPDQLPRMVQALHAESGSLDARARAYLEVNCAHCHQPMGSASSAGLDLRASQSDAARYGVWKSPVATGRGSGGHRFDIVPGKPEESILLFRMTETTPAVRMPNLARGLVDHQGVELIREWIREMPADPSVAPSPIRAGG